jgi:hypothetical protein
MIAPEFGYESLTLGIAELPQSANAGELRESGWIANTPTALDGSPRRRAGDRLADLSRFRTFPRQLPAVAGTGAVRPGSADRPHIAPVENG